MKYRFTQKGTFSIAILLPLIIFIVLLIFTAGPEEPVLLITLGFAAAVIALCLITFYKLTIDIDDSHLSFKLGSGIVKRKYLLSDIRSCIPVINTPFQGIGIRIIPGGWLFNVSGLKAIELKFRNSGSVVRIGTSEPEAVAAAVNSLIQKEDISTVIPDGGSKGYVALLAVLSLAFLLPVLLIFFSSRETRFITDSDKLKISGMYGLSVNYSDISSADTLPGLPAIKRRINGYAYNRSLKGHFTLWNGKKVLLFVEKGKPPYIHMVANDQHIYLNTKEPFKTRRLYATLKAGKN